MEFSEQVLIVRTGRFREADLWVRFLSPMRGLLTAFAFGGCRSRKRFCGCLDLFNRALLRVKSTRGGQYLSIQEGTLLRGPDRLRRDWPRFGAAVNCLKFLEALGCGPEGAAATHQLVEDVLDLLEGGGPVPDMLPVLFRLRLAAEQGYAPRMDSCATCGADLTHAPGAAFLVQEGAAQCDACAPLPGPRVRVEREALDVLRFVQENSPLLWPGVLPPAPGQDGATPDLSPRADSTRNGFAGGASPRFLDGRFPGSLSGLAFGDGGHGSLDDCLCRLPDSALAEDAATQAGPAQPGEGGGFTPASATPPDRQRRPLWNGSAVFESDPFGPVSGSEDMDSEGMVPPAPPVAPAAQTAQAIPAAPGPSDRIDTTGMSGARGRAAMRRQCTRAVDGFIQFHIGLAWDNGRFRRL